VFDVNVGYCFAGFSIERYLARRVGFGLQLRMVPFQCLACGLTCNSLGFKFFNEFLSCFRERCFLPAKVWSACSDMTIIELSRVVGRLW